MITLSDRCEEGSTYAIKGIQFIDEGGDAILPNENPTWTMCDVNGNVLHSGTITAALSSNLILSGEQTTVLSSELATAKYNTVLGKKVYYVQRTVTVRGLINSTLGNGLPITQEFIFIIDNIDCIG